MEKKLHVLLKYFDTLFSEFLIIFSSENSLRRRWIYIKKKKQKKIATRFKVSPNHSAIRNCTRGRRTLPSQPCEKSSILLVHSMQLVSARSPTVSHVKGTKRVVWRERESDREEEIHRRVKSRGKTGPRPQFRKWKFRLWFLSGVSIKICSRALPCPPRRLPC